MAISRENMSAYSLDELAEIILVMHARVSNNNSINLDFFNQFLNYMVKSDDSRVKTLKPRIQETFEKLLGEPSFVKYHTVLQLIIDDFAHECSHLNSLLNDCADHGRQFVENLQARLRKPINKFEPIIMRSGGSYDHKPTQTLKEYQDLAAEKSHIRTLVDQSGVPNTQAEIDIYVTRLRDYIIKSFSQINLLKDVDDNIDFDQIMYLLEDIKTHINELHAPAPRVYRKFMHQYAQSVNYLVDTIGTMSPPKYELNTIEELLRAAIVTIAKDVAEYFETWSELSLLFRKLAQVKAKQGQIDIVLDYYSQAFICLNHSIEIIRMYSDYAKSSDLFDYLRARQLDLVTCGLELIRLCISSQKPMTQKTRDLIKHVCEKNRSYMTSLLNETQRILQLNNKSEENSSDQSVPFARTDINAHFYVMFCYQMDILDEWLNLYVPVNLDTIDHLDLINYTLACNTELTSLETISEILGLAINHANNNNNNNDTGNSELVAKLKALREKFIEKKFALVETLLAIEDSDVNKIANLKLAKKILTAHMKDEELAPYKSYVQRKDNLLFAIIKLQSEITSQQRSFGQTLSTLGSPITRHTTSQESSSFSSANEGDAQENRAKKRQHEAASNLGSNLKSSRRT